MQRGSTNSDLFWVAVILVILGLVIAPRLNTANREDREANLKAYLQQMRNAIDRFENDCGCYPAKLEDIVANEAPKTGADGVKIKPSKFRGPYVEAYLGGLPLNPINGSCLVGVKGALRSDGQLVGWIYNPETGEVHAETEISVNGKDYSTW